MDRILALLMTVVLVPASVAAHEQALIEARRLQVSYVDAVSFQLVRAMGTTDALTFDSDFHMAGFIPLAEPS